MNSNWQQQMQHLVDKGRQGAAGLVTGGEMVIDADPEQGFFRVKLHNVQPPHMVGQLTTAFCLVLANGGAMFNLVVKQRVRQPQEERKD